MKIRFSILSLGAVSALSILPSASMAQSRDTWRAATVASAAVAVYGLAKHDAKLTILGAAGAIYSASRADSGRDRRCYDDHGRVVYFRDNDWDRRERERCERERLERERERARCSGPFASVFINDRIQRDRDCNRDRDWNRDHEWNRDRNWDRHDNGRRGHEWNGHENGRRGNDWNRDRGDDPFGRRR